MIRAAVSDEELILFHYREGLPRRRLKYIEQELAQSSLLKRRYDKLCAVLAAADREPAPRLSADFEERLWSRLQARIHAAPLTSEIERRSRESVWSFRNVGLASAAAVLLMFGVIFFSGSLRQRMQLADMPPVVDPAQSSEGVLASQTMAQRVLAMKVAEHLRTTEAVLLTVSGESAGTADPERVALVSSLVASNRLYSVAAARTGNSALAGFLRSLQPVLIELANPPGATGIQSREGLQTYLRSTDLLFRVRAVEKRLRMVGVSA